MIKIIKIQEYHLSPYTDRPSQLGNLWMGHHPARLFSLHDLCFHPRRGFYTRSWKTIKPSYIVNRHIPWICNKISRFFVLWPLLCVIDNKPRLQGISRIGNVPVYRIARLIFFHRTGVKDTSGVKVEVENPLFPGAKMPHSKISQFTRSVGVCW